MFDAYHLLRVDLPADPGSPVPDPSGLAQAETYFPELTSEEKARLISHYGESGVMNSEYRLTGSVELLLPTVIPGDMSDALLSCRSFSVMHCGPGYYTKRKDLTSYLLSYTYAGQGTLHYQGKTFLIGPGEGFLIDTRQEQEYYTSGTTWDHLDLHIGGPGDQLYAAFQRLEKTVFHVSEERFNRRVEAFLEEYSTPSANKVAYIHCALTELLRLVLHAAEQQSASAVPTEYRQLIQWMEGSFASSATLDELAARVNLSKYHFAREFKRYIGVSPYEYLTTLRIQNACLLLSSTPLSVPDIAERVGIPDQNNFTRLFKSRTGKTPGQFRIQSRL